MPFNEDYLQTMQTIAETGQNAAQVYAETHNNSATANEQSQAEKTSVDWGQLVNTFGSAAQSWIDSRNNGGRKWNDFRVEAKLDESTQKIVIFVVVLAVGALLVYGFRKNRK